MPLPGAVSEEPEANGSSLPPSQGLRSRLWPQLFKSLISSATLGDFLPWVLGDCARANSAAQLDSRCTSAAQGDSIPAQAKSCLHAETSEDPKALQPATDPSPFEYRKLAYLLFESTRAFDIFAKHESRQEKPDDRAGSSEHNEPPSFQPKEFGIGMTRNTHR